MDAKFHPAMDAIKAGDVGRLRAIVQADPALATSRSTCSHPTLLQCLVLDAKDSPSQIEMARILVDAGADVNEPLVAAAGIDNAAAVAYLLDRGAAIEGTGGWSPLEEATLLERSARPRSAPSARRDDPQPAGRRRSRPHGCDADVLRGGRQLFDRKRAPSTGRGRSGRRSSPRSGRIGRASSTTRSSMRACTGTWTPRRFCSIRARSSIRSPAVSTIPAPRCTTRRSTVSVRWWTS